MSYDLLEITLDRGVRRVWMNSDHNRNAMSLRMLRELIAVANEHRNDPHARALVLGHRGRVFCAGVDLVERRSLPPGEANHSELLAECLVAMWECPTPLLCEVTGPVRGGGMGLLSCADIVVAGPKASFAYSEVRVGVAPALVGSLAMMGGAGRRLIPWLFTGESFDATTAGEVGLVTHVVDEPDRTIDQLLDGLRKGGPTAQRETKHLARSFAGGDAQAIIAEMTVLSARLFDTDEAREGMQSFAEKRPPAWAAEQ